MRYSTEREEHRTWIALSACWTVGGLVAWLTACYAAANSAANVVQTARPDAAMVTAMAVAIAAIGVVLRLPILFGERAPSDKLCRREFSWVRNLPAADSGSVDENGTASLLEEQLSAPGTRGAGSHDEKRHELNSYVLLLLGYAATWNWLGYLAICSGSIGELLPALLIVVSIEVWLHKRFLDTCQFSLFARIESFLMSLWGAVTPLSWQHRFSNGFRKALTRETDPAVRQLRMERAISAPDTVPTWPPSTRDSGGVEFSEEAAARESENTFRTGHEALGEQISPHCSTRVVVDDQGRKSASGSASVQFAAEQKLLQTVVMFGEPFSGELELEFELEHEDCFASLVNQTALGARFEVRRTKASEALETTLQWYAVERLASDVDSQAFAASEELP